MIRFPRNRRSIICMTKGNLENFALFSSRYCYNVLCTIIGLLGFCHSVFIIVLSTLIRNLRVWNQVLPKTFMEPLSTIILILSVSQSFGSKHMLTDQSSAHWAVMIFDRRRKLTYSVHDSFSRIIFKVSPSFKMQFNEYILFFVFDSTKFSRNIGNSNKFFLHAYLLVSFTGN